MTSFRLRGEGGNEAHLRRRSGSTGPAGDRCEDARVIREQVARFNGKDLGRHVGRRLASAPATPA